MPSCGLPSTRMRCGNAPPISSCPGPLSGKRHGASEPVVRSRAWARNERGRRRPFADDSGRPRSRESAVRCHVLPPSGRAAWDRWVAVGSAGHMHQTFWWAEPLRMFGLSSEVVAAWTGDDLLGGTLFRCTKLPRLPARIVESLDGPTFQAWDRSYAKSYSEALAKFVDGSHTLAVIIRACPDPAIHHDLSEALRRLPGDVVLTQGVTDAVLSLDHQTLETLSGGFSQGLRRAIKRARANAVEVRRLEAPDGLRAAYDTWIATARRKGFDSVRPWPALEPVLRHSVSSGSGVVFGAVVDGVVVASVFATYLGRAAEYVYGGQLDGTEHLSSASLLQSAAIEEAIDRGLSEYSFGVLPAHGDPRRSGIDQFKLSFGAVPRPTLDTITWRRHVLLYEGLTRLRGHPLGARIERSLRRRAISAGSAR